MSVFDNIKLLALDVDGVLTDGKLYIGPNGDEFKTFHVHDGQGIKLLRDRGVEVVILSSRQSVATQTRMNDLGIKHCYLGEKNKLRTLNTLIKQLNITLNEVAYMGDDLPDYEAMLAVGLPIAVANATAVIKNIARLQTQVKGGEGAVREVCEKIIESQCEKVSG